MRKHQQPRTRKTRKPRQLTAAQSVTRDACAAIAALGRYQSKWLRDEKPTTNPMDVEFIEGIKQLAEHRLKTCRERDFPRWIYRDRGPALNPDMLRELPPLQ